MIMPADRPNTRTDLTSADICTREEEHSVAVDTSTTRSVNASWSVKTKVATVRPETPKRIGRDEGRFRR